jgi:3-hydroxybutyryl-CoA dehydrogenase
MTLDTSGRVCVVGAGIMGAGIAQVAAQAGHRVMLYDARPGAAAEAHGKLAATLDGLAHKGKLAPDAAKATAQRITVTHTLGEAAGAALVIEAIVENAEAKRGLFQQLEAVVSPDCVLASNTSSLSITALAHGLAHPGRVAGMHFFNPVPQMKLVEVVSGLQTDAAVAQAIFDLSKAWGKVPVHARSTPGFIVNRIARPYYAEALALLQERAAEPAVLDACLRGAGFRMGPCELMDLIGHDTNFAVTQSVYEANFGDKRYAPSLVQRELLDAGRLGRKSGRGFYRYAEAEAEAPAVQASPGSLPGARRVVLHGVGVVVDRWAAALSQAGRNFERHISSPWCGLEADGAHLRLTDGRPAGLLSVQEGISDVALYDLPVVAGAAPHTALAWCAARSASPPWQEQAPQWLAAAGWLPQRLADTPGLVVARTVAMLINEAADAVQQGVCAPEAADAAMKLGVNYPAGPFEWLAAWDAREVVRLLDHLDHHYRGERYRVSPELRQRAWAMRSAR